MKNMSCLFSIITPTVGSRPRSLALAIDSVAVAFDRLQQEVRDARIEMLIGFDGIVPEDFAPPEFVRHIVFPRSGNFGNFIRDRLLRIAAGTRTLFLDDDNALTPEALCVFARDLDTDLVIARIDTSGAFAEPFIPRELPGGERVVQGNVDPLCLSVRTEFARVRGRGWESVGGYESDYLNILRYYRRAGSVRFYDDVVGVYDAGRGLDANGMNTRQKRVQVALKADGSLPSVAPWRQHG